jgi:hypothetical protein
MTALCRGEFEISASVEEARLWEAPKASGKEATGARPRTGTQALIDTLPGAKDRKIWHTREPCILVVTDEESSDDEE